MTRLFKASEPGIPEYNRFVFLSMARRAIERHSLGDQPKKEAGLAIQFKVTAVKLQHKVKVWL
jgi:hypothetical protein